MQELKKLIIQDLKSKIQEELDKAKSAFETTRNHASEKELKAEGKYDTRSIEAGYLAGAQKKRVDELELEIQLLDEMNIDHPPEKVSVGSLVEITLNNQNRLYFISSTSGGSLLNIQNNPVLVISAFSPIGSEAIGLEKGDTFEVEAANETREYEITQIF